MTSRTTMRFRNDLRALPAEVRKQAAEAYKLFLDNPRHPSLQFKQVHATEPIYSVRISRNYRAVGVLLGQEMLWFWIGAHGDYEKLLRGL
jgi:mRNA-degrading endonuclease RelE of RelBE toxin-antitoxin system